MIKNRKRTRDDIQRVQEIRRSSAASPHSNKSKYSRKPKYKGKGWE